MKLRYIGKDGAYGFKKGEVYKVEITSWPDDENIWVVTKYKQLCSFGSLKSFASNWEDVRR